MAVQPTRRNEGVAEPAARPGGPQRHAHPTRVSGTTFGGRREQELESNVTRAFVGVDVQSKRRCAYAVLGADLVPYASGWLEETGAIVGIVANVRKRFGAVAVGIDAPRQPLEAPRRYYWRRQQWCARKSSDVGSGRHCEVIVKASGIANPQWTPVLAGCPEWMKVGFRLYAALSGEAEVHEVFPSASYYQLATDEQAVLSITLKGFAGGPKDMLDAYVAAFTVHEFLAGRGVAIGGGDGLGTIMLPRPLARNCDAVSRWPTDAGGTVEQ